MKTKRPFLATLLLALAVIFVVAGFVNVGIAKIICFVASALSFVGFIVRMSATER